MVTLESGSPEAVFGTVLRDIDGVIHAADFSADLLAAAIEALRDIDDPPAVRLLARRDVLKTVTADFISASHAADLVDADVLDLRVDPSGPGTAVLAAADRVVAVVDAGAEIGALATDDGDFVAAVIDVTEDAWADAEAFPLRTPPLSRITRTLGEDIGPAARDDFDAILASLETARGAADGGLDEVTISLLVAARNEELLYDISKWGEDAGIASKATFSRTKTELEEMGLLDTEKVPIDVGRPRLRLKFAHPRLTEASIDELASVARALIDA